MGKRLVLAHKHVNLPRIYELRPRTSRQNRFSFSTITFLTLIFLMFVVPAAHQSIKLILIAMTIASALVDMLITRRLDMHPSLFLTFVFYLAVGSSYALYGFIRGNPGALPIAKETVVYVFVYMLLITSIRYVSHLEWLHKMILAASIFLCVYIICSFFNAIGIVPNSMYINLYKGTTGIQVLGVRTASARGFIGFGSSSLPSLLFLQPYLFTYLLINTKERHSILLWLGLVLSTVIMIFCGRRVLLLIALTFPILILIFVRVLNRNTPRRVKVKSGLKLVLPLGVIGVFVGAVYARYGFNILMYIKYFLKAFAFETDIGAIYRKTQFHYLLHGWMEHPIFGVGSGGVQWQYIRSSKTPWLYELSYIKYLFDFGLVGICIYGAGIATILFTLIKIYKKDKTVGKYALPILMGCIAFLIGNATNPYFLKFDYLLILFLPILLVNVWLLRRNKEF